MELKDIEVMISENERKMSEIKAESNALLKIKKRLEKEAEPKA